MRLTNSAKRDIESVALRFASELNAIAEDLANEAHSGIDCEKLYDAIAESWVAVGTLHEEYSAEIDSLYAKYFQVGA